MCYWPFLELNICGRERRLFSNRSQSHSASLLRIIISGGSALRPYQFLTYYLVTFLLFPLVQMVEVKQPYQVEELA
jgi:hypothetical protein